jgi:hypothetical protein
MKELDLNDLADDAVEPIIAVLNILTGGQENVHIYRGEQYLYTIHKASEREIEPGVIKGNYQPDDNPGEVVEKIRGNLVFEEKYQAKIVEKAQKDIHIETESH